LEASALQHASRLPALSGRSPLLRLQSDERLIAMTRRGNQAAFEALVQRYQSRLLAFCRHMLGCTEDAEDVLQEVFAASYNAMLADDRPINARPWLYRIARNRCLNHLRRPTAAGQDSMDVYERDGGTSTADTVHKREEFRQIVADVQDLPETQRTALLLREIDALSYDQISQAMETTVPSVKSLLVRARVSLAEAAEARLLSCDEVRLELGQVAEGLTRTTAPVRRHLKSCERCRLFRTELRRANRALAAVYPIGAIASLKLFVSKLGAGAAGSGSSSGAAGGAGLAGGAGAAAGGAGTTTAGGILSAGATSLATKAAAGLAAAAIVTAGAAEVKQATHRALSPGSHSAATAAVAQPPASAVAALPNIADQPLPVLPQDAKAAAAKPKDAVAPPAEAAIPAPVDPTVPPVATTTTPPVTTPVATTTPPDTTQPAVGDPTTPPPGDTTQTDSSTVTLPDPGGTGSGGGGSGTTSQPTTPPGESPDAPTTSQSTPAAGEAAPSGSASSSGGAAASDSSAAAGYGPAR
jgi:RNA polymerase sigma factor (sigma-70 family)